MKENTRFILGFLSSNLLAVIVLAAITTFSDNHSGGNLLGLSTFLLLPFAIGIVCAWFWRDLIKRTSLKILCICANIIISFGLAAAIIHEGVFCLIIVSPLIVVIELSGYYFGEEIFKKKNNTLNISTAGLLLLLGIIDMKTPHHFSNSVVDEMVVNAPPAKVWQYVVAYPTITQKSHYWFFDIGLPKPIGTSVTGYCKGAGRKCIFEKGLVFDEIMSTYDAGNNLTFDVVKQPQDPEIMGHINIERGQFILKDNHNGTTTLVGTSWYSLNVFPALYFDLWAKSVTRNVHVRVMEHIKSLSEKP